MKHYKHYIDADKLRALLVERYNVLKIGQHSPFRSGKTETLRETIELIDSLQQEQLKDKQIVIVTESHGNANIEWDCRSLDDAITLLKIAESFITEKQVEKLRGMGSGPDYNTT